MEWGNLWFCLRTSAKRRLPNGIKFSKNRGSGASAGFRAKAISGPAARWFASFLQLFSSLTCQGGKKLYNKSGQSEKLKIILLKSKCCCSEFLRYLYCNRKIFVIE